MKVMNLTTHGVSVKNKKGEVILYKQSGYVARAISNYEPYGELDDNVVIEKEIAPKLDFGIKEIQPYTIYIVSYQFGMKLKNIDFEYKHQFVYPCSCKAERDKTSLDILSVPSLVAVI